MRATPRVSRTTTIREVPTRSKSVPCSRYKVLSPSDTRPGYHPGLPHSPSNKPPQSRGVQFDKVVTGLLGLSSPIKFDMRPVQIKACHRGQNDWSLIDAGGGYHTETSDILLVYEKRGSTCEWDIPLDFYRGLSTTHSTCSRKINTTASRIIYGRVLPCNLSPSSNKPYT
jgi:hypothetical protein